MLENDDATLPLDEKISHTRPLPTLSPSERNSSPSPPSPSRLSLLGVRGGVRTASTRMVGEDAADMASLVAQLGDAGKWLRLKVTAGVGGRLSPWTTKPQSVQKVPVPVGMMQVHTGSSTGSSIPRR